MYYLIISFRTDFLYQTIHVEFTVNTYCSSMQIKYKNWSILMERYTRETYNKGDGVISHFLRNCMIV